MGLQWGVTIAAVALVVVIVVLGLRTPQLERSADGLTIRHPLFGRTIPATDIRAEAAHVVDFATSPGLRPKWRTMGIGLPGYQIGWFRLNDGEKALLFVKGSSPVVHVPTTAGYALLISSDRPQELLASIRAPGT
jgi:hypothetical protein